jgi:hypothetical protein
MLNDNLDRFYEPALSLNISDTSRQAGYFHEFRISVEITSGKHEYSKHLRGRVLHAFADLLIVQSFYESRNVFVPTQTNGKERTKLTKA